MQWYLSVLKKYTEFSGRARRKEYWMFTLFNTLAMIALMVVDYLVGAGFIAPLYMLAVLLPSIGVLVRRLHDTGRSGWWYFICLVPLVGGIILLVFLVQDSHDENDFGANPKLATE